ncbi:MAG: MqnA/MqnD/SBP family protein [Desulfonatronovibrionaceae bacterium]
MSERLLNVGISPCPNDSYIFAAWILGLIDDVPGCRTRFRWEDVQTLNEAAEKGGLQAVKVSAATAVRLPQCWAILESGGAFGLEHGPKLVTKPGLARTPSSIAVPGLDTSAYALLRAALARDFTPLPMRFDRIPEAILNGQAEGGLLIHETALVYTECGFELYLDLGQWWAEFSGGLPIPLGCIVAVRGKPGPESIEAAIRRSIDYARHKPQNIRPLIESLAQETDAQVVDRHITAYVNEFSLRMGESGRRSLELLQSCLPPGR